MAGLILAAIPSASRAILRSNSGSAASCNSTRRRMRQARGRCRRPRWRALIHTSPTPSTSAAPGSGSRGGCGSSTTGRRNSTSSTRSTPSTRSIQCSPARDHCRRSPICGCKCAICQSSGVSASGTRKILFHTSTSPPAGGSTSWNGRLARTPLWGPSMTGSSPASRRSTAPTTAYSLGSWGNSSTPQRRLDTPTSPAGV